MAQRKGPGALYPARTLRLLLVNPALPESFWSFCRRRPSAQAALIALRLLWRGIAPGGPARLLPLAVNDWIVGLALRRYAERSLT
jgi:hypothetical protein